MAKIIIGIHGLGNKPPKKLLTKWWKKSIREGLQAIGHPRFFFKFELVYWANFLHSVPRNPKIKDKKDPVYLKEPYVPGLPLNNKRPSRLRQKFLDYLEKQIDKIFLKKDLSLHFASVSDLIMRRFFKDLDAYYSQACIDVQGSDCLIKDVIREQLAQVIRKHKKKTILLIGHSMGSIIAYDVLTQTVPEVKIDTLVTIGSPLGLPIIMSKIASEQKQRLIKKAKLGTPENVVNNWFNFSDLRDRVALSYNLSDDYDENSNQVRVIDKIVYNNYDYDGKRNPHKIYGYLRTVEFARVVHEFLNHGRNKKVIWLVDKINCWFRSIQNAFQPGSSSRK
jgi:hypothetical protein